MRKTNKRNISINVVDVDWELLREQKIQLILTIQDSEIEETKDALMGILNLIDTIQDSASEQLGEDVVFEMS